MSFNSSEGNQLSYFQNSRFRPVKHLKMTVWTSVLWKMSIHMSKKWPEMVVEPYMCSHFYIESEYTYLHHVFIHKSHRICFLISWLVFGVGTCWIINYVHLISFVIRNTIQARASKAFVNGWITPSFQNRLTFHIWLTFKSFKL